MLDGVGESITYEFTNFNIELLFSILICIYIYVCMNMLLFLDNLTLF